MRTILLLASAAVALLAPGCTTTTTSPGGDNSGGPLIYVALGASDAVGIGAFPLTDGYVYLLRDRMRDKRGEVTLHNFGINGAKVDEFLSDELEPAIAVSPDVVTIWTGSNDVIGGRTPAEFAADLDTLLRELRARTTARVFVADLADLTMAPFFRVQPDPDVTKARVDAFNVEIHAAVARNGAVLVPLSAQFDLTLDVFSIDGFHPSNTGYRLIADVFWDQIEPTL